MDHLKGGADTEGMTVCAIGCLTKIVISCAPVSLCVCLITGPDC